MEKKIMRKLLKLKADCGVSELRKIKITNIY